MKLNAMGNYILNLCLNKSLKKKILTSTDMPANSKRDAGGWSRGRYLDVYEKYY